MLGVQAWSQIQIEHAASKRKTTIPVPSQPDEIEVVQELANSKGIDSADLIREWILERIGIS